MFNKKIFAAVTLSASLLTSTVSAATITNVLLTDFDNSIITVSGTAEADEKNVSVVMLPQEDSLSAGEYTNSGNISIQSDDVDNGTFSVSFKFPGASGNYNFYTGGQTTPYAFEYISKATVLQFVSDLGNGLIAENNVYSQLEYYSPSMGIDLSFATSDTAKDYIAKNIVTYKDRIKTKYLDNSDISGVDDVVKLSKCELEFMDELETTLVAVTVNSVINEYTAKAEIDLTAYNQLSESARTAVCSAFVGKSYTDMQTFRTDFNTQVTNAPTGGNTQTYRPGSSGNGGSGYNNSPSISFSPSTDSANGNENAETPSGTRLFEMYNDVKDTEWAWESILFVSDRNIMNGSGDGTFEPDSDVTREQIAKILILAFGGYNENALAAYGDVPNDNWALSYINSAKEKGYMNGISDTDFGFGLNMTREDLCTAIYRAALSAGYTFESSNSGFADFDDISDYAKEAISALHGSGIINGIDGEHFAPKAFVTRAQIAKIIYTVLR